MGDHDASNLVQVECGSDVLGRAGAKAGNQVVGVLIGAAWKFKLCSLKKKLVYWDSFTSVFGNEPCVEVWVLVKGPGGEGRAGLANALGKEVLKGNW